MINLCSQDTSLPAPFPAQLFQEQYPVYLESSSLGIYLSRLLSTTTLFPASDSEESGGGLEFGPTHTGMAAKV